MTVLWKGLKVGFAFLLILLLLAASTVLAYLLYDKYKDAWGKERAAFTPLESAAPTGAAASPQPPIAASLPPARPASAKIDAPIIRQYPELPAGCEVTSLAMLFAFAGIEKSKMELYNEMPKDPTPIAWNKNGTIKSWGNPNVGYVGDATPKAKGFGIFHAGLFPLLQKYIPTAVDLTRSSFNDLEAQIAKGVPVLVWTTVDFKTPDKENMVVWDSPLGLVQTTFMEHAVLLVGYDDKLVYVNDPLTGNVNVPIDKSQFIDTWVAMGRQGLSYIK